MNLLKHFVATVKVLSVLLALALPTAPLAQTGHESLTEDQLFQALQSASAPESARIESLLIDRWSNAGSKRQNDLLSLAKATAGAGNLEHAVWILDTIIAESPEFAEAWNVRATIHFVRDDLDSSVADIAATLALNPRHFAAMNGLALVLEASGNPQGALDAYRAVQEMAPMRAGVNGAINRLEAIVEGQRPDSL